jgi:dipeptidyl aminopeptidase/acylaminoacyl peptidase
MLLAGPRPGVAAPHVPTVDDLLAIRSVGSVQISPDGAWAAYTVTHSDFEQDAFVTHVWVVRTATGEATQLTRGPKSVGAPRWSPDGAWLAFTSGRVGDKTQLFVIRPDGGEAVQLTKVETGVNDYAWSPDGAHIAFTAAEPESQARKDRKDRFGDFDVVRRDYAHAHIWTLDVAAATKAPQAGTQRTRGRDFHVGQIAWAPDGKRLAFSATVNPDLVQGGTSDIYVLELGTRDAGLGAREPRLGAKGAEAGARSSGPGNAEDDRVRKVVDQAGPDNSPRWSPDGTQIAFGSAMGRRDYYHANSYVAIVPAAGGTPRSLTEAFDEDTNLIDWKADGIYFTALQKTAGHLFRVDPANGRIARVSAPDQLMGSSYSLTRDARQVAFVAGSPTALPEVFVTDAASFTGRALTTMSDQLKDLVVGTTEVISWKSQDGTTIEGVLTKPRDFDSSKKYPLLVRIHGGPTGIDRPALLDTRYYPTDAWVGRGALMLKVNYRGSAGYGEKFRQLNVRNLGVGDAWDVLSGVDHLVAKGWVDPARVGCMGWSQGGYISAFLTTSSTRFAAISVGAGISNWATYYYNTDITPFTINYLGDDPADDPEIYRKTSPMSYIKQAKTPTLIQHGENDRRVPIPNAYELRQGLEDRGVPVEMVVYKGFGHGITKPKAMHAVMQHNLDWFNHHLWGDPLPDFTGPARSAPDTKTDGREF